MLPVSRCRACRGQLQLRRRLSQGLGQLHQQRWGGLDGGQRSCLRTSLWRRLQLPLLLLLLQLPLPILLLLLLLGAGVCLEEHSAVDVLHGSAGGVGGLAGGKQVSIVAGTEGQGLQAGGAGKTGKGRVPGRGRHKCIESDDGKGNSLTPPRL